MSKLISVRMIFLLVALAGIVMPSAAAEAETSMIEKANSEYHKGEFRKAADLYLDVAKTDGFSASLFFDLANCYAMAGEYGQAMLYYSRAHKLDPSDKSISNNMKFIASKVEDSNRAELKGKKISVTYDPETFFDTVHRVVAKDHLSDTWASWSVASFILTLACVALYLFCSNVTLRKAGFFGGLILLILSVVFVVCAFSAADYQNGAEDAVITAYKVELLGEPSADAKPVSSQLCQGTVVYVMAEEQGIDGGETWLKVRLNSNFEGWLKSSDLETI